METETNKINTKQDPSNEEILSEEFGGGKFDILIPLPNIILEYKRSTFRE
jgi:hypothetical protein